MRPVFRGCHLRGLFRNLFFAAEKPYPGIASFRSIGPDRHGHAHTVAQEDRLGNTDIGNGEIKGGHGPANDNGGDGDSSLCEPPGCCRDACFAGVAAVCQE